MPEFKRSLAVVIGINQYVNGIPALKTAVNDANKLALILEENYQYKVLQLLDEDATKGKLSSLLAAFEEQTLPFPDSNKIHIEADDRFLFYFAGHGFAQDGLDNADEPVGFIVPQDGRPDEETWLSMQRLHDALIKLPCRHLLIILDCCFAGTFRWAGRDREMVRSQKVYRERYDRFIAGCAQQVITSAASDEKAADSLYRFGQRGDNQGHSPFAELLFQALSGEADFTNDEVITATELYVYLRDKITSKQTPEICQLKRHDKGEYIFPLQGFDRNLLEEAPALDEKTNPYKGLMSFEEADSDKFFGRKALTQKLQEFVTTHQLTVVLGASGSGKSSLVKAGLIPQLSNQQGWYILSPLRPGEFPFSALNKTLFKANLPVVASKTPETGINTLLTRLTTWSQNNPNSKLLLVIDQCEELVTLCRSDTEREKFLNGLAEAISACPEQFRLVLTLSNDFEPQLSDTALKPYWKSARFLVPAMTREELREAIVEPAAAKVMYFEPPTLVDELIDEVMQMPGALPLLSFTLSELYFKYIDSISQGTRSDRAMTQADYEDLGGVTRSLTQRADLKYEQLVKLDPAYEQIIKNVMLRMVAVDSGELARRRVFLSELEYPSDKNEQVQEVIRQFTEARLLVKGQDSEGNLYVEPAHDALVRGWEKLRVWKQQEQGSLILQRRLTPAAIEWNSQQQTAFHWSVDPRDWWKPFWDRQQQAKFLWHTNPRLDLLKQVLDSTDNWFNQVEAEFVRQSVRQRRKNTIWLWGSVTAALVMLSATAVIAIINAINAQNKLIQATSALSESLFASNKELEALKEAIRAGQKLKKLGWVAKETQHSVVQALQRSLYRIKEYNRLEEDNKATVGTVSFSPQANLIATVNGNGAVKLWLPDGTLLNRPWLEKLKDVSAVAFSPNGKMMAAASGRTVTLWNLDGQRITTLSVKGDFVGAIAFSPDGKIIATASNKGGNPIGTVQLWNPDHGTLLKTLERRIGRLMTVAFSPDSKIIVSGGWFGQWMLWKKDSTEVKIQQGHLGSLNAVDFSPDGKMFATTGNDGLVKLWNLDGKELPKIEAHKDDAIWGVHFSPQGNLIATASNDRTVKIWRADGTLVSTLQGHRDKVNAAAFSLDEKTIASASDDGTVRLWKPGRTSMKALDHSSNVFAVAFSPDDKKIVTTSGQGDLHLWQRDGMLLKTDKSQPGVVSKAAFSPNNEMIATAAGDKSVKLRRSDGTPLRDLEGHTGGSDQIEVLGVSFSPDSKMIAAGDADGTVKLWKTADGKLYKILGKHGKEVWDVSFSPTERSFASASEDGTVKLWYLDGALPKILSGHNHDVFGVAFSPDGKMLASASADKTVKLWKSDGTLLKTLSGHNGAVIKVAFSPDGKMLASASADKTVKLWKSDGTLLKTLSGHNGAVVGVAFSPDGKTLASASYDGTVMLWNWQENQDLNGLLEQSCNWVQDYLKTNPKVKQEDRHLCDRSF